MPTIVKCDDCNTVLRYQTPFNLCHTCQKARLLYGDAAGVEPDEERKRKGGMTHADIQKLYADNLERLVTRLVPSEKTFARKLKKAIASTEDIKQFFLPEVDVKRASYGVTLPQPCPNPLEHIFEEPEEEEPRLKLFKVTIPSQTIPDPGDGLLSADLDLPTVGTIKGYGFIQGREIIVLGTDRDGIYKQCLFELGCTPAQVELHVTEIKGPFKHGTVIAYNQVDGL